MLKILCYNVLVLSLLVAGGCGDSSEDEINTTPTSGFSGVIVDPYIEGAVLCEDLVENSGVPNNVCDSTELRSSASNAAGSFTFSQTLTPGSHLIIAQQGLHNGKLYDLDLAAVVNSAGTVDVISPMTTLAARGLTESDIAEMLTEAGFTGFNQASLLGDPMTSGLGDKTISQLTSTDIVNLQASLATYGILRVMDGSTRLKSLTGIELNAAVKSGGALASIVTAMATNIKSALSLTSLQVIDTMIQTAKDSAGPMASAIPDATFDVIIKVAVTIMDRLTQIGYETCNGTTLAGSEGTAAEDVAKVTAALTAVQTEAPAITLLAENLGQMYYGKKNKSSLSIMTAYLPADIQAGMASTDQTFIINSSNQIVGHTAN